jgi:hypothetical protein
MSHFREKIPSWGQLAPVYSVIMAFVFTQTLIPFFWKVPSWLYYLSLGKIFVIYAYVVVVNFIESALILSGFVLLSFFLPKKLFYERFVSRASIFATLGLSFLIYFDKQMTRIDVFPRAMVNWIPLVLVGIIILTYSLDYFKPIRGLVENLADRATVFLYLVLPLSAISLMIVLIRNIN